MQDQFHDEGIFGISITPLGASLCLLEELQEGSLENLLEGGSKWLEEHLKNIRRWTPSEIDHERLIWLKDMGILVHAWKRIFFDFIAHFVGFFIQEDEKRRLESAWT